MSDEATQESALDVAMCSGCGRMHGGGGATCASCGGGLPRSANRTRKVTRLEPPAHRAGGARVAVRTGVEPVRKTRRLRRDPGTDIFDKIRLARAEVTLTPDADPGDR